MTNTKNSKTWDVTIAELLTISREAITSLLPSMDKARIPWRKRHSYDDWDKICRTIYDAIVVNSISHSLGNEAYTLLEYDKMLQNYGQFSVIFVERDDSLFLFSSFDTNNLPLDAFRLIQVDHNMDFVRSLTDLIDINEFKLLIVNGNEKTVFDRISIEL